MTIREAIKALEHTAALNEAGLLSNLAATDIKRVIGCKLAGRDPYEYQVNIDYGRLIKETSKIEEARQ